MITDKQYNQLKDFVLNHYNNAKVDIYNDSTVIIIFFESNKDMITLNLLDKIDQLGLKPRNIIFNSLSMDIINK